jgi:hypothetical protein
MKLFRPILGLIFLVTTQILAPPQSCAWGCKGHYIIALIAGKHLNPHARAMATQILDAAQIDPKLSRYCKEAAIDVFVDSSTWADDQRSINPSTAGWHFIDIPRGVPPDDISQYCSEPAGCVTEAITEQLALLRNPNTSPSTRADALRYLIHFIGDIHQPLHTTSNNDRGGNCVPVNFFGRAPVEINAGKESFQPNLHSIWDIDLIELFAGSRTVPQIADDLDTRFKQEVPAWLSAPLHPASWAWEGHEVAESAVYGFLPIKIAIEKPREVTSCADDDHIAMRMLNLNEKLDNDYQKAVTPVVQEQLAKAGVRLAAVLNQLWP